MLYHRWKKYDKAEESYRRALQLKPDLRSAQENLEMLLRQTRNSLPNHKFEGKKRRKQA